MQIRWYFKQLFPLTYRSEYADTDGNPRFCVWKMWFGKCYNVEEFAIKERIC